MTKLPLVLGSFALLLSSAPMFADTIFNFSFTGSSATGSPTTPFSGIGTFDTTATSTPGKYLITAVTGTTDGSAISGIIKKGGFDENDNFLFVSGSSIQLDNSGVSYKLANGLDVGLFLGVPDQDQETIFGVVSNTLVSEDETTPIAITAPTPEPESLLLLSSGLLGVAGIVRRRRVAQTNP